MNILFFKQISALEKVFLTDKDSDKKAFDSFSALRGEKFSYQIMYRCAYSQKKYGQVKIESPIKEHITLFSVGNVPAEMPCYPDMYDEDYITTEPGLFPDVLFPMENNELLLNNSTRSLWVDVNIPENLTPAKYPITISISCEDEEISNTFELEVIPACIPEQETVFTQWFHTDCISNYFNVEVFSEEYWKITENYVRSAVDCGINMLLTPIFTPPLDTEVGGERKTVQLVDVYLKDGVYSFGFERFERWVQMCLKCGIKYIEISHLFTQWGVEFTPKIIANVNGEKKRIFGWDVKALSNEYRAFLDAFLPDLVKEIDKLGIREKTCFHISDEPREEHIENYSYAKNMLKKHLHGFKIMDALSDYEFYKKGVVEHPVVLNSELDPFLESNVEGLWTYTCCYPPTIYSNRFLAMPSGRNRVIGAQMYKFGIVGFLHWGLNFYTSQYSKRALDPYATTDADSAFPGGDCFTLYPYKDGAIHSIKGRVFYDALQDIRVFKLLESKIGKDKVVKIIEDFGIKTFADYTHDYSNLLMLRSKVNKLLKEEDEQL